MKKVAAYYTPGEACVALTRLQSAGIDAVTRDEFSVRFNWLWSNAIGGIKIEVPDEDYADALEVLAEPMVDTGIIRCPHCGSSNTWVRPLSVFGALCIVFKIPIPMTLFPVNCRACKKTHQISSKGETNP